MLDHLLAKSNPDETLVNHTKYVVEVWEKLRELHQSDIKIHDFWKWSFLSILFHDFGKIADNFQKVIKGKEISYDNYIRHELLSGIFLFYTNPDFFKKHPLSLMAVFSHHKPLNDFLFQDDTYKSLEINKVDLQDLVLFLLELPGRQKINYVIDERLIDFFAEISLERIYLDFSEHFYRETTSKLVKEDRKKYIWYKAILNIADWTASGNQLLDQGFSFDKDYLANKIVQKLKKDGKIQTDKSFKWLSFQKKSLTDGSIIAVAPTGSGKTEAALLWASQKKKHERIIYLLPTRITSNAIYKRLSTYFGTTTTAIVHSSAFFLRKEKDDSFNKINYLKDKTFFRNINICTIDQVLTQGFNLGYWELKTFHLLNARVIIDEIHLYQPYTLGLIIASIRYLKEEFNTHFYIMSATMPESLKNLLTIQLRGEDADGFNLIQDDKLLNKARNTYEVRDCKADSLEEEINQEIDKGKKVLIVVNTVNEAIRLYDKFKDKADRTICYHSRFIQKHRRQKEEKIEYYEKEGKSLLLIATQVVEVSLDIDFDILFTENAPVDAIIQRAGRVNRSREKKNTKVVLFQHTDITAKYVYDTPGILERSFSILKENNGKRLTESELLKLVEKVYEDFEISDNPNFKKGIKKYDEIQKGLHFIKDNLSTEEIYTREGLDTINVIPEEFRSELKNESVINKAKYELSVRRSKEYSYRITSSSEDKHGFRYIEDAKYSYKKGLEFKTRTDEGTMTF